jgi:carboxynorspermidine decarboxylase
MRRCDLPTPCYLVSERALARNLEILKGVSDRTGCKILLAQKAFSMFAVYPLVGKYLSGAASSGLFEARLAHEHMPGENHTFSPAFRDDQFDEIAAISGHIVFNSLAQYEKFGARARAAGAKAGLRVNPEHSTQDHAIYDPCAPGSRLGIRAGEALPPLPEGVSGLHFHTLCEQDSDALEATLEAVVQKFGPWLKQVEWINFGGGHHITRPGYDIERLERCVRRMQDEYGLMVYLEPGEAIALNAGVLITEVLDIVPGETDVAILDTSAACHMPDVIEMPYRPPLLEPDVSDQPTALEPEPNSPVSQPFAALPGAQPTDGDLILSQIARQAEAVELADPQEPEERPHERRMAGQPGEKPHTYRLAGPTCLAGDVIGDYSFSAPLKPGTRLEFCDMAIYTMVKNNTFNGMPLPAIALEHPDGTCRIVRSFSYEDFKHRLS